MYRISFELPSLISSPDTSEKALSSWNLLKFMVSEKLRNYLHNSLNNDIRLDFWIQGKILPLFWLIVLQNHNNEPGKR